MAYRQMKAEEIYEMYRRSLKGQAAAAISRELNVDRKTVNSYLEKMAQAGLTLAEPNLDRYDGLKICEKILPETKKKRNARSQLDPLYEFLKELVLDQKEPLKPKTAFLVAKEKHGLTVSYTSFKRFARERGLLKKKEKSPLRIELSPGREVQIDYGKVGRLYDSKTKRNRDVYAFVAVLAHSRHMFVQFVHKQDQVSFCNSIIDMLEFFGGSVKFISIDNLKAGVIKPDLYDPQINRSLAEVAEYYGFFVNPCRVRTPTDKGKVERQIPVAREAFLRFKNVQDAPNLASLNKRVLEWLSNDYGLRVHGTTKMQPITLFNEIEREHLTALPGERFNVPLWKEDIKVHRDRFIQFEKKRYSLPQDYCGKSIYVRKSGSILKVYYNFALIRQYVISEKKVQYRDEDFPADKMKMLSDGYPRHLIAKAASLCSEAELYISAILEPHAYLNIRQALGLLSVLEKNRNNLRLPQICIRAKSMKIVHPKVLTKLINQEERQLEFDSCIPISTEGEAMIRNSSYYTN